ncbi:MAG: glycosyltransferase family 4 protein [Patescibacteria group bacterium]|jgi:phosphatidylinositol alpha-mannosyltransferase
MNIGIVSESYYPAVGGISEHIHNLAAALRLRGHSVKIITTSYGEYADAPYNSPDVLRIGKVFNFHKNGSQSHVATGKHLSRQLREIFAKEQFDVLHIHAPEQPMLSQLSLLNSTTVNVGTFHAQYDRSLPLGFLRPLVAPGMARLHARIVVSDAAQQSIAKYFPEGAYTTVPNGVDVAHFASGKPLAEYADRPNILFVGNFVIRKGFVHLLEAFLHLRKTLPKVRLLAVGDGNLRPTYERELGDLVGKDVIFTGRVPNEALPNYYASAQVYCSPATGRESFGIVLLEAMAAGRPVVASDIPGYRAVVGATQAARMVPVGDTLGFAAALAEVLTQPEKAQAMAVAGQRAAKQYAWEHIAAQVEQVYQQARAVYPATVPVVPGYRWLSALIRSRKWKVAREVAQ